MTARRCPICERVTDGPALCPEHRVPGIDPAIYAASPVPPVLGARIAERYRLEDVLGVGGMAAVYGADDRTLGRSVALKLLRPQRALEPRQVKRFYLEARALAAVRHPNVVELLDFGVDERSRMPFLVMRRIEGHTLSQAIGEGPLSEARACAVLAGVARGVAAAHEAGFAHRDLKPDNVMITGGDRAVVLDFGVAKSLRASDDRLTLPGASVGTPEYMSPEQARGGPVDARSDLYGLGCVLYAALAGQPPFTGASARELMTRHLDAPVPPLPAVLADGSAPSAALVELARMLLAKAPDARPASAGAVAGALEALSRGDGAAALSALVSSARARARAELAALETGHAVPVEAAHDTVVAPVAIARPDDEATPRTPLTALARPAEATALTALDRTHPLVAAATVPSRAGIVEREQHHGWARALVLVIALSAAAGFVVMRASRDRAPSIPARSATSSVAR